MNMRKGLFSFLRRKREHRDYPKEAIEYLQEMCIHLDIKGKSPPEKRFYALMKKMASHGIANNNIDLLNETGNIGAAYLEVGIRTVKYSLAIKERNSRYNKDKDEIRKQEEQIDSDYRKDVRLEEDGLKNDLEALLKTHGFERLPKPSKPAPAEPEKKPYATPKLKKLEKQQAPPELSHHAPNKQKTDPEGATRFVSDTKNQ